MVQPFVVGVLVRHPSWPSVAGSHEWSGLTARWQEKKREFSIGIDAEAATHLVGQNPVGFCDLLKTQDVVYIGPQYSAGGFATDAAFAATATPGFDALSRLAGRLPSAMRPRGIAPTMYTALAEWDTRAVLAPRSYLRPQTRPVYFGGRLDLSALGSGYVFASSTADAIAKLSQLTAAEPHPGAAVIELSLSTTNAVAELEALLESLETWQPTQADVVVTSVRGLSRAWADVSYEHAVPREFLLSAAKSWADGNTVALHAVPYDLGSFSPGELLYLMAQLWHSSLTKGKVARNATPRSPLGPIEIGETSGGLTQLAETDLVPTLEHIIKFTQNGRLPALIPLASGGSIGLGDLAMTIASGFVEPLTEPRALAVKRGHLDAAGVSLTGEGVEPITVADEVELDTTPTAWQLMSLLNWTYKPALEITVA